jgi:hypothetical protein
MNHDQIDKPAQHRFYPLSHAEVARRIREIGFIQTYGERLPIFPKL